MSDLEPGNVRERGALEDERQFELSLRPARLGEYIGQKRATENLGIYIRAARQRREALDHVLLTGPPGLGKTTLSNIIANEMGAELRSTAGPVIEKPGDLAALLTNLQEGDVLFERARAQGRLDQLVVLRRRARDLARHLDNVFERLRRRL